MNSSRTRSPIRKVSASSNAESPTRCFTSPSTIATPRPLAPLTLPDQPADTDSGSLRQSATSGDANPNPPARSFGPTSDADPRASVLTEFGRLFRNDDRLTEAQDAATECNRAEREPAPAQRES